MDVRFNEREEKFYETEKWSVGNSSSFTDIYIYIYIFGVGSDILRGNFSQGKRKPSISGVLTEENVKFILLKHSRGTGKRQT